MSIKFPQVRLLLIICNQILDKMKQKIQYLNDARTLAILWVVLIQHNFAPYGSHFGWVPNGSYELFSSDFLFITGYFTCISMPICFFIAGVVACLSTNAVNDSNGKFSLYQMFKKKTKRLLLPAIIFGIIFQFLIEHAISYKAFIGYMHFWFVIDLFFISLIFLITNDKIGVKLHIIITLVFVILSSLVSNRLFNFSSGYFYYFWGWLITIYRGKLNKFQMSNISVFYFFFFSVLAFVCLRGKSRDMIEPIFAIPVLLVILKNVKFLNNSFWLMLCKYSYGIYIFHMLYLYIIYNGINKSGGNSFLLENATWISSFIAFVTIPLSILTTYLVNKIKLLKI